MGQMQNIFTLTGFILLFKFKSYHKVCPKMLYFILNFQCIDFKSSLKLISKII